MKRISLAVIFAFSLPFITTAQSVTWNDMGVLRRTNQKIVPASYRTMSVDFETLKAKLLGAPPEGTSLRTSNYSIQLPTPDGGIANFNIVAESTMEPGLQERYPEIRTYIGLGMGEYSGAIASLDFTLQGFHAQILMSGKTYYIDPITPSELNTYIVYSRDAFFENSTKQMAPCEPESIGLPEPDNFNDSSEDEAGEQQHTGGPVTAGPNGTLLRTYQIAVAATGEYTNYHGGTISLALSAIITTMNRVNGIYRRDLSLRMIVISNNDQIIFTNPITDGYSNGNFAEMLNENQEIINDQIGSANYDIGHVFSVANGGRATLGTVCNNSLKARGVSAQLDPVGDPFDVDYVSHEIGHQWDADHTFNNTCGGARVSGGAYEPGSGSTIMAYAGICFPNLQVNSDDYFHNYSYNQMRVFSNGAGNSCATATPASNAPPIITMPSGGFFIPRSTPFELTASATDPNGDPMTYCWEQYNLGPATASPDPNLSNPSGNAPIFRSWEPSSSTTRVFPRITDLVNNTTVLGENLPTYTRNLTFQFTVRDNWINGGVNDGLVSFEVISTAGPFVVTAPNIPVAWTSGGTATVNWDVAGTNNPPVNCDNVTILLSTDGGLTYPITLVASTPNDGNAVIDVPELITSQARVKVKAINNIFFDISNANFIIEEDEGAPNNDAVCEAITIGCGQTLEGSNVNATSSSLGEPSCAGGTENDVFYRFSAFAGNIYTVSVNGDNYDGVLALYTGNFCTSNLTEVACADEGLSSGIAETIIYAPEEDQNVFIQTYDFFASGGEFDISLTCEYVNDDPCGAISLLCGDQILGSTVGATESIIGSPDCSTGSLNDLFYRIDAIGGVTYIVTVNGDNYDGVLAAYTSDDCEDTFSEIACSDEGTASGIPETIEFSLSFDETVFIQTYDWFLNSGDFTITVDCEDIPFDEPCDARDLTCGESYSGTSFGATPSDLGEPSCASGSQQDVFFKFNAQANVEYSFVVSGENYDGVVAAYTGSCDGVLTEIACVDEGLGTGITETLIFSVPSDIEVFIQVYDWFNFGQADFTITMNCPIPENDECADAIPLSVNPSGQCPGNQVEGTTFGATSSNPDACENGSGDVYYEFNSGDNSEVIINLNAITATDLVLSVFEGDCSSSGLTCAIGTNQSTPVAVNPSTTYYVRVHSFFNNSSGSFNICIEEPASEAANVTVFVPDWDSSCAERDVRLRLYQPGSTILVEEYNSLVGSSGSFEIMNVPIGTYDVFIKIDGYLQEGVSEVTFVAGNLGFGFPQTRLGDLNNDNIVNFLDGSAFNNFLTPQPYDAFADYNCDGLVNFVDASALNLTFGQTGDNPPIVAP